MHIIEVISSRVRLAPLAVLILSLVGFGSSASAAGSQRIQHVAYQLHMVFFSHEAGLSTVIDPQMFVYAPGTPAGTGPQRINHVANFAPALAANAPQTKLYNANGRALGVTLRAWKAANGRAMLRCRGGVETIRSRFRHLIPHGYYTLFVVHLDVPKDPGRFTPLGASDGSNDSFVADAAGQGHETNVISSCLTPGREAVVLVWHSGGQILGSSIGSPGVASHNQLIFPVP